VLLLPLFNDSTTNMARNREKANLMFNRWASMKEEQDRGGAQKDRRPFLASEVKSLPDAERWRRQVIGETARKVAEIQNAGLGEARIRDLNDEINKLLREKGHWERQIKALKGPDYAVTAPKMFDAEGKEVAGSGGYKYFGAAKDLPGVRELLSADAGPKRGRTRAEIFRGITPDYYGYRDEEDGELVKAEADAEKALHARAVAEFEATKSAAGSSSQGAKRRRIEDAGTSSSAAAGGHGLGALVADYASEDDDDAPGAARATRRSTGVGAGGAGDDGDDDDDLGDAAGAGSSAAGGFRAHVPLPSQQEIEAALLERKRQLLLAKYVGTLPGGAVAAAGAGPAAGGSVAGAIGPQRGPS
jgi:pre-mRNA-splicing factor ISY1